MSRQMTLDLPVRAALERADFFVAPSNAAALAMIDAPQLWPQGKLLLVGPSGSGKSHLAEVFAHDRQAMIIAASDLFDMPVPPAALVVEDADRITPDHEERLFHLHNRIAEQRGLLLLTARLAPARWGLRLPDLLSRMQGTAIATLNAPDDALLAAVLLKQFSDRQIHVPPAVITYLVGRMDRSFAAACDLVAHLDARALAEGRAVSRAMAAEALDMMTGAGS